MYGRSSDNKRRAFGIDNIEPAVVEPSRLTPAETASQEGDLYYSAGQLEDALICYKKAQQVDTIPVLCMAKEAAMYLCQGKYDEYTNACDRALVRVKKAVQDADKSCARGEEFLRMLEYRDAKIFFDEALNSYPFHARALAGRSVVYLTSQQYAESLMDAEKATALDERNVLAWCCKGFNHLLMKEFNKAQRAADRANQLGAYSTEFSHPVYHMLKSLVHIEVKDFRWALESAEAAIRDDPACAHAWITKGNCLLQLKEYHLAKEACDKAVELSPSVVWCHSTRSFVLVELGQLQAAMHEADTAVALDSSYANAWNAKALCHFHMGEFKRARCASTTAIACNGMMAESFSLRALINLGLGDNKAALKDADQAVFLDTTDLRGWKTKGEAHHRLRHFQRAAIAFEKAITLAPHDEELKQKLATTERAIATCIP